MQKENARMVGSNQVNSMDDEKPDRFNSKVDDAMGRISYDSGIRNHFYEELQVIAGILDMLVVIGTNEHMGEIQDESVFVIMDARSRAKELSNLI